MVWTSLKMSFLMIMYGNFSNIFYVYIFVTRCTNSNITIPNSNRTNVWLSRDIIFFKIFSQIVYS